MENKKDVQHFSSSYFYRALTGEFCGIEKEKLAFSIC